MIILAACALPDGAATGSYGGTVQQWKWDEDSSTLTPVGSSLQLEGDHLFSLAAAPGPDGSLQLVAGCDDGSLRVLGSNGAGGALQLQAALGGHSAEIMSLTVMTTQHGAIADGPGCGAGV